MDEDKLHIEDDDDEEDEEEDCEDEEDDCEDSDYDYDYIYSLIDTHDRAMNGVYDEEGNAIYCSRCGEEYGYDRRKNDYYCRGCGERMSREEFFQYIGANPPGADCLTYCRDDYPLCKQECIWYDIDPNDPMLR